MALTEQQRKYQREYKRKQRLNPDFKKTEYERNTDYAKRHQDAISAYHKDWHRQHMQDIEYVQKRRDANKAYQATLPKHPRPMLSEEERKRRIRERMKLNGHIYSKRYWSKNPEKQRNKNHRYRARRMNAVGQHTVTQWIARVNFYGEHCAYCGEDVRGRIQLDHVIALAINPLAWASNLVPACRSCNSKKRTKRWIPRQPKPKGSLPE